MITLKMQSPLTLCHKKSGKVDLLTKRMIFNGRIPLSDLFNIKSDLK